MKKYILGLLLTTSLSYAGLINAIAIIVNDEPITLYDIDKKIEDTKVSKQEAVSGLIDELLYKQELKKNNISVDILDIDDYIGKLAQQNGMNILDFKSAVRGQQDYELFTKNIEKQILHQKLVSKIASNKLKIANDMDIEIYYKNNKNEFELANSIDVVAYLSKDKQILNQIKSNPMLRDDRVIIQNMVLEQSNINPQVKYIVNSTKENSFSTIFVDNKAYNMLYIKNKRDIKSLPLVEVKETIFNKIMRTREQNYLKDYFETLKITADIKILR